MKNAQPTAEAIADARARITNPCAVTGEEVRWETAGRPDACGCGNCRQYLKPPEAQGETRPVTVAHDADPLAVLRTMAAFLPGEDRGIAEIRDGDRVIGYAALRGHPEKLPMPVFDAVTRVVECVELGAWLQARGFEKSACRWEKGNTRAPLTYYPTGMSPGWRLVTGPAAVPAMPPETKPDPFAGIGEIGNIGNALGLGGAAAQEQAHYEQQLQRYRDQYLAAARKHPLMPPQEK